MRFAHSIFTLPLFVDLLCALTTERKELKALVPFPVGLTVKGRGRHRSESSDSAVWKVFLEAGRATVTEQSQVATLCDMGRVIP